jgi:hypothetical protein
MLKPLMVVFLAFGWALIVPPAAAKPVKSGALEICQLDGGTIHTRPDGSKSCCATPKGAQYYCIICGKDGCNEYTRK